VGSLKGAELLGKYAPNIAAKAAGMTKLIDDGFQGAVNSGAAQAIMNSKVAARITALTKGMGKSGMFGETLYDPENNNQISSFVSGALTHLILPFAASSFMKSQLPMTQAIVDISNKYGINLPVKPGLEQITRYIPISNFKNLMQRRAAQINDAAGTLYRGVTDPAVAAMSGILSDKEVTLKSQLETMKVDPSVPPAQIRHMESRISNAQDLQKSLAEGKMSAHNTYDRFLVGRLADSYAQGNKIVSDLNNELDSKAPADAKFALPASQKVAQDISNTEGTVFEPLRKNPLLAISNSILGEGSQNEELSKAIKGAGITDPNQLASILDNMMKGRSGSAEISRLIRPILPEISDIMQDLSANGGRTEIEQVAQNILGSKGNQISYSGLRDSLTRIGRKVGTVADVDGSYSRFYGSLSSDLRQGLVDMGNPELLSLYDKQAEVYSNRVAPFKSGPFNSFRTDLANADNFSAAFLTGDNRQGALDILNQMPIGDESSKLAARASVVDHAFRKAWNPGVGLNPVKFINEITDKDGIAATNNITFEPEQIDALESYKKLINVTAQISPQALKAGKAAGFSGEQADIAKPVWHERALVRGIGLVGGAALATKFTTLALPLLLSGAVFSRMINSEAARKFLIKLNSVDEATIANNYNSIIKKVYDHIGLPTLAIGAAGAEHAIAETGKPLENKGE